MNGCHNILRIDIDESVLTEDKAVLEDLLAAAANDAVEKVKKNNESTMSGLAENLKMLGSIKFPF